MLTAVTTGHIIMVRARKKGEMGGFSLENISPLLYDDLFKRYEVKKKQNKRRKMLRKTPSHCLNVSQCDGE